MRESRKRRWAGPAILLALVCCILLIPGSFAEETAQAELPEWTVMFYFCGSDLESRYGYATENLKEIGNVRYPDSLMPFFSVKEGEPLVFPDADTLTTKVNVLIETGGSSEWHTDLSGNEIRTDALQRWRYSTCSMYSSADENRSGFELLETLPLRSMADPETLGDFIRWSAQTCPAKKYALVLWDHGGGALTGLFADDKFSGDTMWLYELKNALSEGGVRLETLVIDACLMANLETAAIVKDYAGWLVASEEEVPGKGTDIGDWLQELYINPECDGKQLGRTICDTTLNKYASTGDSQERTTLTWSVIDLSRFDRVLSATDRFFAMLGDVIRETPELLTNYAGYVHDAEEYGNGQQDMRDITSIFNHPSINNYIDRDLRNEIVDALSDAVVYTVRGTGRSQALGLSFCYPTNHSPEDLDRYALNCPSLHYLAFLDAVTDWTAPDWVYEQVERLPQIDSIERLQVNATRRMINGFPTLMIDRVIDNLSGVYYRMYRLDEASGQVIQLGRTDCKMDINENMEVLFWANEPWNWPAIEGMPCDMELVLEKYQKTTEERLYNIPVQIGTGTYYLRCARFDPYDKTQDRRYEIYGVWEGYNETTQMTNRSVIQLAQLAGQEYRVLWPLDLSDRNGKKRYMPSGEMRRIARYLDIREAVLPAGTYYIEYEVDDMFMRPCALERIEMHWDGKNYSFPDGFVWEGSTPLQWGEQD